MRFDFPLAPSILNGLRSGAVVVPERPALFSIQGSGALDCLQGLLTVDLVGPGDGSLVYGAMLSPKGMILLDPFILRENGNFVLVLPAFARETALAHFARVLPPRLAKVRDLSGEWEALWLLGPEAPERLEPIVENFPGPGRVRAGADSLLLAAAGPLMPFAAVLVGPRDQVSKLAQQSEHAGARRSDESVLAAARVLAGWPSLGREIDEKTLPQEVRYDELGAVSYVKGCYAGQETVARVHFRGHPNRNLKGVTLEGGHPAVDRKLVQAGKEVGVLRSALILENRVLALATLRSEVADEAVLVSDDREARVVPLPFTQEVAV